MNLESLNQRIDQLIELGQTVLATRRTWAGSSSEYVDSGKIKGFRSATLSFIERVYGQDHSHYKEFNSAVNGFSITDAEAGVAILHAIRDEIAGGWLFSVKGLITAEIFADFLEMSEYLLKNGYKDPSAVVAGSVLEEHLRQLCTKHGVEVELKSEDKTRPKKAEALNSDLAKAEIYSKLDQKMVTAWLDLRNKAAHGKYEEYTTDQVTNMLSGITEFMARISV